MLIRTIRIAAECAVFPIVWEGVMRYDSMSWRQMADSVAIHSTTHGLQGGKNMPFSNPLLYRANKG